MTNFASPIRAALIGAFLWLSVSTAQAADSDCQLIFEAIPSKDAGPIIGGEVSHKLATKNFATGRAFTHQQATVVAVFLETNFGEIATFSEPIEGFGGFEGKSSPNAFITVDFREELQDDALGKAISEITAAVGYMLIQDGTVANCEEPVGKSGQSVPLYSVSPDTGFKPEDDGYFERTVYSAMVVANDDLDIGYTFTGKRMLMLDFGRLTEQLENTNAYLKSLFVAPVSIKYHKVDDQPTIYAENDWAVNRDGTSLLKRIDVSLYANLRFAQQAYIGALRDFASIE